MTRDQAIHAAAGWVARAAAPIVSSVPPDAPDDAYTTVADQRITAARLRELARAVAALTRAVEGPWSG